jgi:hypothetical protein
MKIILSPRTTRDLNVWPASRTWIFVGRVGRYWLYSHYSVLYPSWIGYARLRMSCGCIHPLASAVFKSFSYPWQPQLLEIVPMCPSYGYSCADGEWIPEFSSRDTASFPAWNLYLARGNYLKKTFSWRLLSFRNEHLVLKLSSLDSILVMAVLQKRIPYEV